MKVFPLIKYCAVLILLAPIMLIGQNSSSFAHVNRSKEAVINNYRKIYLPARQQEQGWVERGKCQPGTLSAATLNARLQEINYFRDLVGLEPVVLDKEKNEYAQAAAFLMRANGKLSHDPPQSWKCYSKEAAQGAGSSNLGYGGGIYSYIEDFGGSNKSCGHRMWLLKGKAKSFGYGGTDRTTAVFVFGQNAKRDTLPTFVAYPPAGFVPAEVVSNRWTFAIPGTYANYESAKVTVTLNGKPLPLTYQQPTSYGDGGLAFELADWYELEKKILNNKVKVRIRGVKVGNSVQEFSYEVAPVQAEGDGPIIIAYEDQLMATAAPDNSLVALSGITRDKSVHVLALQKIEALAGVELSMDKPLTELATKLSKIRMTKNPEKARFEAYARAKTEEILHSSEYIVDEDETPPPLAGFVLLELKKAVPLTGGATFGKVAEVLAKQCMEDAGLQAYLKKHPGESLAGMGIAAKRFQRHGKTHAGMYVSLIFTPKPPAKASGQSGQSY